MALCLEGPAWTAQARTGCLSLLLCVTTRSSGLIFAGTRVFANAIQKKPGYQVPHLAAEVIVLWALPSASITYIAVCLAHIFRQLEHHQELPVAGPQTRSESTERRYRTRLWAKGSTSLPAQLRPAVSISVFSVKLLLRIATLQLLSQMLPT
jgi:hypothetical protein